MFKLDDLFNYLAICEQSYVLEKEYVEAKFSLQNYEELDLVPIMRFLIKYEYAPLSLKGEILRSKEVLKKLSEIEVDLNESELITKTGEILENFFD